MKALFANKLILLIIGGLVVVAIGAGIVLVNGGENENDPDTIHEETGNTTANTASGDDFQRTGQYSFGLAVCEEMSEDEVAMAIATEAKIRSYK